MAFKEHITEEELDELLRPKLRLFMSVDVIGSTSFKHSSEHAESQGWLDFFYSFYNTFSASFANQRARIARKVGLDKPLRPPRLWKALGDELIYEVELQEENEAAYYLSAFRSTVNRRIRHQSQEGEGALPISFKATAWLAGFPVGNAAIPLERTSGDDAEYDYVGPLIDIGFRLTHHATTRRFIISVDLAWLISTEGGGELDFFYEGRETLRGVLENRTYPIIWIDAHQEELRSNPTRSQRLAGLEDRLLGREKQDLDTLAAYCRSFIEHTGEPLMLPWIEGDTGALEINRPVDYEKKLLKMRSRLHRVFIKGQSEFREEASEGENPLREIEDKLDKL